MNGSRFQSRVSLLDMMIQKTTLAQTITLGGE
jgi:hypothetical protein